MGLDLEPTERDIYFFDLVISSRKRGSIPPKLPELVQVWTDALRNKASSFGVDKSRVSKIARRELVLLDYFDHTDAHVFYIAVEDYAGPDFLTSDRARKVRNRIPIGGNKGRVFGAHLVIKKSTSTNGNHVALLERVPTVTLGRVQQVLGRILHEAYKADKSTFTCLDSSGARTRAGQPKRVEFLPKVTFSGHVNVSAVKGITPQSVKEIYLEEKVPYRSVGSNPAFRTAKSRVYVDVDTSISMPNGAFLPALQATLKQYSGNFDDARITFKDPASNRNGTLSLNDQGAITDEKFVKSLPIRNINPGLGECEEQIAQTFAQRMISLL